jgi:DNA-binding MarR family transcriptional regulator
MPLSLNRPKSADENRKETTAIIDAIRSIIKSLRDSGRDVEQTLGVTPAQLYVLEELRYRPASINELAERTYTHQSSVSIVVGRLVDNRLVTRVSARGDARKVSISLTAAGRAVLRKSPGVAQARLLAALNGMKRSDLKELSAHLTDLASMMDEKASETERRSFTPSRSLNA